MPQLEVSAQSLSVCDTTICAYDQAIRPRKSRHRVLHDGVDVEIASCQAHPATAIDSLSIPHHLLSTRAEHAETEMTRRSMRSVSPPESHPRARADTVIFSQTRAQESRKPPVSISMIPSSTPPAELRRPPANAQKSRRRCIDFGLGRAPSTTEIPPSPLSQYVLTSASPRLTTHAGTASGHESETSSLSDNLDMVFPQPPPMILRRTHSSPLLSAKGTFVARSAIDICGDRKLHGCASDKHSSWSVLHKATPAGHWASVRPCDLLEQLELELEAEALLSSKAPPVVSHVHPLAARASESYDYGRRPDHASIAVSVSGLQSLNVPSASQRKERHNTTLCASKYARTGVIPVTDRTRTLSPARSTSSLSSAIAHIIQREKIATSTTFGPTRSGLSKARSAIPVAPLDHLDLSRENQRTSRPQGLHCPTSNNPVIRNHQKMSKRTHLSNLFTGFGGPKDSLGHLKSLGPPFHHRLTRDQPGAHVLTRAPSPYMPKSFIDITPEQDKSDSRGTRRNLTRKLLVKAGRGILGWGRGTRQETKHV